MPEFDTGIGTSKCQCTLPSPCSVPLPRPLLPSSSVQGPVSGGLGIAGSVPLFPSPPCLANSRVWAYNEFQIVPPDTDPVPAERRHTGKQMNNLGDQTLAKEWIDNTYLRYCCWMRCFEYQFPFNPSDFFHIPQTDRGAGRDKGERG